MSLYAKRGVSAQKEEVHAATRHLDKGLYPKAFCKIYPDVFAGDPEFASLMHADGAGTKSVLAYLYWKETGDLSVWRGIAQDAIVMNLDDLLCVGIYDQLVFSSTIDRNKKLIPGEVLEAVIQGSQDLFDQLAKFGVRITYMGGETADVGDVVRSIAVNGTMAARWPRQKLVTNEKIAPGQVIVGLASYGKASYETSYNSGIASNGLTSARHDMLHKEYAVKYPSSYETSLDDSVVYIGPHRLTDPVEAGGEKMNIGQLLLSPTRSFAPVMKVLLTEYFDSIKGLIHCSGGGQTKCLKYLPEGVNVVKDNLLPTPEIFQLIQAASGADNREMYQVFNMGTRLEVYCTEKDAQAIIDVARGFNIDAQIIGRTEAGEKGVTIKAAGESISYQ